MIEQPAWCFHSPSGEVLMANSVAATISMLPSTNWYDRIAPDEVHLVTSIADWSQLERTLKLRLNVAQQFTDYTVRLRVCEETEQGEASNIAIAIPLSVIHKDVQGRVVFANRQYFRTTGLDSMAPLLGRTDEDLFAPEFAAKFRKDDQWVMQTRQTFRDVEEHPSSQHVFVETIKAPLLDDDGKLVKPRVIFWQT